MTTKKIITSLFAIYLVLTGCKKDLDLRPTDTVDEEVAFNSVAALDKGLNTAYARYGSARVATMLANSLTSDELKFGPNNGGFGQFGFRLQYNSDNSTGSDVIAMFYTYYPMLDQVNRVLAKVDVVPAAGAEIAQRDYIKGQLLALRAMGHFELLEAYSKKYDPADPLGIPIMTASCLTCQPARNTVAEVITQVEKDLSDAKALMPAVTVANYNDLDLNPLSVTAYQARIALYKGEWQKAADMATTVINSGIKPLVSGTAFAGIWTDANTNEILFRSRFENSTIVGVQWNNAGIIFSPSDKLTNSYSTDDIRLTSYIGTTAIGRYVKKFSQSSRGPNVVDVKGIRTAEMYLIRAEARAELNDLAGAAADINSIRSMRITGYTPISAYASKAAAITDIFLERFRELAFEGFRFYDLKRKGMNLQRDASDVDSPLWQTLLSTDPRFVYPIPADELLANRNMIQNDGY
jgi:hypothetical protein